MDTAIWKPLNGSLKIKSQKLFSQHTYYEGDHCYADADDGHLQETGLKGPVLGYGCVVCKAGDDQDDDDQHTDKSQYVEGIIKNQVWSDQQYN